MTAITSPGATCSACWALLNSPGAPPCVHEPQYPPPENLAAACFRLCFMASATPLRRRPDAADTRCLERQGESVLHFLEKAGESPIAQPYPARPPFQEDPLPQRDGLQAAAVSGASIRSASEAPREAASASPTPAEAEAAATAVRA